MLRTLISEICFNCRIYQKLSWLTRFFIKQKPVATQTTVVAQQAYIQFCGYYDPERMHFGTLRVLNDDIVQAGMGFGTHPHDNMEIISIPLEAISNIRTVWEM